MERMGLGEVIDHRVGTFSRGMRQRLGVADVLIKQPQLIIMDEPTQGWTRKARASSWRSSAGLKHEGITILLSSHLLYQVQAVCDRVGLSIAGAWCSEGTV
jgi:ABC-2 type transport system ATP-binding protein